MYMWNGNFAAKTIFGLMHDTHNFYYSLTNRVLLSLWVEAFYYTQSGHQ